MTVNYSNQDVILDKNSIFLAGPTRRDSLSADSWRTVAVEILERLGFDGVVYFPEYEGETQQVDFVNQVEWEKAGLMGAGAILFNLCRKFPETPGLTTNVEFGAYLVRKPESIVLCSPVDGDKNRYLEWMFHDVLPEAHIYQELEDALLACMETVRRSMKK